jgi:DNA invertase Pin-like site-specific DNA recombinase
MKSKSKVKTVVRPPRTVIYSRISSDKQSLDSQLHTVTKRFPDAEVATETCAGNKSRPVLKALVKELCRGDTLVVFRLDRLGRKLHDVIGIIEDLEKKGVILISVSEGVDYGTMMGRMVTQILVSVAEMERAMLSERIRAGMAAAKAQGRMVSPHLKRTKKMDKTILAMHARGHTVREIGAKVGISHNAVWQFLKRQERPLPN